MGAAQSGGNVGGEGVPQSGDYPHQEGGGAAGQLEPLGAPGLPVGAAGLLDYSKASAISNTGYYKCL